MNELLERCDDYARKYHRRILGSKLHHNVLKITPFHCEGHFPPILRHDLNFNGWASCPPTLSNTSSVNGIWNGSWTHASLSFCWYTQILIPPFCFFSVATIEHTQLDSSIDYMIPTFSILSSSRKKVSLHSRLSRYRLYLIGFVSGFIVIFITPKFIIMPFKSENLVGNRS